MECWKKRPWRDLRFLLVWDWTLQNGRRHVSVRGNDIVRSTASSAICNADCWSTSCYQVPLLARRCYTGCLLCVLIEKTWNVRMFGLRTESRTRDVRKTQGVPYSHHSSLIICGSYRPSALCLPCAAFVRPFSQSHSTLYKPNNC